MESKNWKAVKIRSQILDYLINLYQVSNYKPFEDKVFKENVISVIRSAPAFSTLIVENTDDIGNVAMIILKLLQTCWRRQSRRGILEFENGSISFLYQLYCQYRHIINIDEFITLMDKLEYTLRTYPFIGEYFTLELYRIYNWVDIVIKPFLLTTETWGLWDNSKDLDFTEYLQWPPEEVIMDIMGMVK